MDVILRGAKVIDGTGSPARAASVAIEDGKITSVGDIGAAAADSIIEARRTGGPFQSLYDLCERVDLTTVNRRILENLIKCGAMSSLQGNRAQLTAMLENAMESGQRAWKDRESGQTGLFGIVADQPAHQEHPLPPLPDWTPPQKLASETAEVEL